MERKIRDLEFERAEINIGLLHQELKAALGDHFTGVSFDGKKLRVHLFDDAPADIDGLAGPVVAAHTSSDESAADKRQKEDAALLDSLRGKKVDQWKQEEKDRLLEILLSRVGGI